MKNKKGDAGTNIAALVLIIGLFILLFMVFIPQDLREELLPGTSTGTSRRTDDRDTFTGAEKVLLSSFPGEVSPFENVATLKELTPALLYSRLEKETIDLSNTITLDKNLFTEVDRTFNFDLADINNIEKLELFMFVLEGEGDLRIEINGEIAFDDSLDTSKVPVRLSTNTLRNKNKLRFVSSRGFLSDEYKLNDIKLIITRKLENKVAVREFSITDKEKNGLDDVTLAYFVNCLSLKEQGTLNVNLNNRLLFNDFVFCDSGLNIIDVSPDRVKSGLNRLEFKIDRGDYQLDDIEVELLIGEQDFPKYNFRIEDEDFDESTGLCGRGFDRCIRKCDFDCSSDSCFDRCTNDCEFEFDCRKNSDIILRLDFKEEREGKIKRANIAINEETIAFDVVDSSYERDISPFINRGDNVIKIVPKTSFEIERLTVFLD
ncbi:MAG: hypothetical protein QGF74_01200 [Candidatus Nanoarchaeia archaeon]|jgi:hypothetical protein|nr:hypothetical protein [Candidatus Nanoarchaeia archaeon]|tara:strand:+ start:20324 stop:21619 length:1296 start_codon:yes stop_codon:yes gene_type:complete